MKHALILMFALLSSSAFAAGLGDCANYNDIAYLQSTKSFANQAIKVANVYTEEPAAAADHLLVFIYDKEMGNTCTRITRESDGTGGFGFVDMKTLRSVSYDAKKGLLLQIEVSLPDIEGTGKPQKTTLKFRANQATGKITLE